MPRTRLLDRLEIRILGALLEKEQTTPDYYPLTLKALRAACNQKSNREPVMELGENELRDSVEGLQQDVLVWRSAGARSARFQHSLDRRWDLQPAAKAVITLLLLRGPQTAGELRARCERLHPFAHVGEVEQTLAKMAAGFDALVRELPRQAGKREIRWIHLLADEKAAAELEAAIPATMTSTSSSRGTSGSRLDQLETAVEELRSEVAELRGRLDELDS